MARERCRKMLDSESYLCYNVQANIAACFAATEEKEDAMGDYQPT